MTTTFSVTQFVAVGDRWEIKNTAFAALQANLGVGMSTEFRSAFQC